MDLSVSGPFKIVKHYEKKGIHEFIKLFNSAVLYPPKEKYMLHYL